MRFLIAALLFCGQDPLDRLREKLGPRLVETLGADLKLLGARDPAVLRLLDEKWSRGDLSRADLDAIAAAAGDLDLVLPAREVLELRPTHPLNRFLLPHLDGEYVPAILGRLDAGLARAVESALVRFLGDHAPAVRALAARALGAARLHPAKVAALLDDEDAGVRAAAAAALGGMATPKEIPKLVALLGESGDVRRAAALALARLGRREGDDVLVPLACAKDMEAVRVLIASQEADAIAGWLPVLGSHDTAVWAGRDMPRARLEAVAAILMKHASPDVRAWSASILVGRLGLQPGDAVRLIDDPDVEVRSSAAFALSRVPVPGSADRLVKLLADPAPTVRSAAVYAVAAAGRGRELLPLLKDPDAEVAQHARWALQSCRDVLTAADLGKAIGTPGGAWLLALAGRDCDAEIEAFLDSDVPAIRAAGLAGLRDRKRRSPRMRELLGDGDRQVRLEAARSLAVVGIAEDLPALLELRDGDDGDLRAYGMEGFLRLGPADKVAALLSNGDATIAAAAIEALVSRGTAEHADAMLAALPALRHERGRRSLARAMAAIEREASRLLTGAQRERLRRIAEYLE